MTGSLFDRMPMPPCAELLGWHLIDHDAARGWVRVGFDGKPTFLNPAGVIQGGILAAMLDDCMGPAAFLKSGGQRTAATIAMTVSYLAPARPGPLVGDGRVIQFGHTVAHLEATLADAGGREIARASSSVRVVPLGGMPDDSRPR